MNHIYVGIGLLIHLDSFSLSSVFLAWNYKFTISYSGENVNSHLGKLIEAPYTASFLEEEVEKEEGTEEMSSKFVKCAACLHVMFTPLVQNQKFLHSFLFSP